MPHLVFSVLVILLAFFTLNMVFWVLWIRRQIDRTSSSRARPKIPGIDSLMGRDPGFDSARFHSRAWAAFSKLRLGYEKGDDTSVRAFLSDGQAECRTVRREVAAHDPMRFQRNIISVREPEIVYVESDRLFDAVHVRFTSKVRFDCIPASGQVLGGDLRDSAEIWTFVRRPGRRTSDRPGLIEGCCPDCGAAVTVSDAGRCSSCRAWLNSGEYDWVLTKVTEADRWLPPSQACRDRGLELLGEADPEANLHFLEDRMLLVFWRWQLALTRKDPLLMRAVTLEESCQKMDESIRRENPHLMDMRLEALRFESFRFGDPYDHLAFRFIWSGLSEQAEDPELGRTSQRTSLTFIRQKGSLTAARAGLCSAHCPNCGSAAARREIAVCEYCGTRFNDGAHHWVLHC